MPRKTGFKLKGGRLKEAIIAELAGALLFALILGAYNYYYRRYYPRKCLLQIIHRGVKNIRCPSKTFRDIESGKEVPVNPNQYREACYAAMSKEVQVFLDHRDNPLNPEEEVSLNGVFDGFETFRKSFEEWLGSGAPTLDFYEKGFIHFLKQLKWLKLDKRESNIWEN